MQNSGTILISCKSLAQSFAPTGDSGNDEEEFVNDDIGLAELLRDRGIDSNKQRVMIMRHASSKVPDLFKYVGTKALTLYQSVQDFMLSPGDIVVGFFVHAPARAVFLGAWIVKAVLDVSDALAQGRLAESFEGTISLSPYYHELEELPGFEDLHLTAEIPFSVEVRWNRDMGREGIDYPVTMRSACLTPFSNLANVSLMMSELRAAVAYQEWKVALCVPGIYLITDELSGQQYVGSASGGGGILQRWGEYIATGHGGNKLLEARLAECPDAVNHFRFTLLERLKSAAKSSIRENYWKKALGSRAFGLNAN
jgi:hypothetical protein